MLDFISFKYKVLFFWLITNPNLFIFPSVSLIQDFVLNQKKTFGELR